MVLKFNWKESRVQTQPRSRNGWVIPSWVVSREQPMHGACTCVLFLGDADELFWRSELTGTSCLPRHFSAILRRPVCLSTKYTFVMYCKDDDIQALDSCSRTKRTKRWNLPDLKIKRNSFMQVWWRCSNWSARYCGLLDWEIWKSREFFLGESWKLDGTLMLWFGKGWFLRWFVVGFDRGFDGGWS
jgi:hypothetical protein